MRSICLLVPFLVLPLGCFMEDPARANCSGIELGSPTQSLPTGGGSPKFSAIGHQIVSKGEFDGLKCCMLCNWGQATCSCGTANCADPAYQATPLRVDTPYSGECGEVFASGQYGLGTCNVWSRNDQVVGVWWACDE